MRSTIKIKDLSLVQWQYLQHNVPVGGREFLAGLPRVCAVFELTSEVSEFHVEMDMVELTGLLVVLHAMDLKSLAEVALAETSGDLPYQPGNPLADREAVPCGHHNPPHLYDCRA